MTPGARLAAAAEVLAALSADDGGAAAALKEWGRRRRFAGARDREAIADHVFAVLRRRRSVAWALGAREGDAPPALEQVIGAALSAGAPWAALAAALEDGPHAPGAALSGDARARLAALEGDGFARALREAPPALRADWPDWLWPALEGSVPEAERLAASLTRRAPLDLRVNTLRANPAAAAARLTEEGVATEPCPLTPIGLRAAPGARLGAEGDGGRAYGAGWVEPQDAASQAAALIAASAARDAAAAGGGSGLALDFCAGAGGKTLALAAALGLGDAALGLGDAALALGDAAVGTGAARDAGSHPPHRAFGRLMAHDAAPERWRREAPDRLARAGAQPVPFLAAPDLEALAGAADMALVDAPCSGSGAWARRPEEKWRLTPAALSRVEAAQAAALRSAARLVRPGGYLIYATCSVLRSENETQAEAFLSAQSGFEPAPLAPLWRGAGLLGSSPAGGAVRFDPLASATDGFFVAAFRRRATEG